jgi:hypothetical protein
MDRMVSMAAVKPTEMPRRNIHSYNGQLAMTKMAPNKKAVKNGRRTRIVPARTRPTSAIPISRSISRAVSWRLTAALIADAAVSVSGTVSTDVIYGTA